jgi:hypothetical protein
MPSEGQRESGTREDGEATFPTKGIPPLPEPDVEGVGNETGPSADKTDPKTQTPDSDKAKMVRDATGF